MKPVKQQYAQHQTLCRIRQRIRRQRILAGSAFLLLLFFIWGNSLQPAQSSSAISTGLLAQLQQGWLAVTGADFPLSHHLLRKLGHFSEFFLLGLSAALTGMIGRKELLPVLPLMLYSGLFAAVTDETLQYFSPGRSPEVRDILIDYAGFCCGLLAAFICRKLLRAMYQGPTS